MITKEKIGVYRYFNGDFDGWARAGSKEQKEMMEDEDWFLLDEIVQDIRLIKKGLASESYRRALEMRLKDVCDTEDTAEEIKKLG